MRREARSADRDDDGEEAAEYERDRAVERAKVAEADRGRLARAIARYHGASRDHRHQTCGYCDALDALPEHIRGEL